MKAVIWTKYGTPDVLKIGKVEKPTPKDNEILMKVVATTVTLGDCEMRNLALPFAFKLPIMLFLGVFRPKKGNTLGQEFSGIVESIGKESTRVKVGDEIFGQTGITMGAYAQFLSIKENGIIAKKPSNISFEEAACVPLSGLEARYFTRKANIIKGGSVLVIGAGGSIGTMGIQLLKLGGAVVAGVDTHEKFDVMKEAGADRVIDYTKENYLERGEKYDVVFDVVGKIPLKRGLALLNPNGYYLHANPKISHILLNKWIGGSKKNLIVKIDEQSQDDLDYLNGLLKTGKIKPIIDQIMPLERIAEAHEYVETGKKKGNLVIRVSSN